MNRKQYKYKFNKIAEIVLVDFIINLATFDTKNAM
jgi:hypothetical protein